MTLSIHNYLIYIMDHCRARDRAEIEAVVADFDQMVLAVCEMWSSAAFAQIFLDNDDMPAAFFMAHQITPSTLNVSFIATDKWSEAAPRFLRWGIKIFKKEALAAGFRRLECRAIAGHADAVMLLERLGFVREAKIVDFGRNGELFYQFAWRRSDHVHFPEAAQACRGTARSDAGRREGRR